MRQPTHAGRRMKPPEDMLGARIAEHMTARSISPETLAARLGISRTTLWRFLQGKTTRSLRFGAEELCAALELTGADREAFLGACVLRSRSTRSGRSSLVPATPTIPGTAEVPPSADVGADAGGDERRERGNVERGRRELAARLRTADISISEFARRVGVAPSTVSRLLRGETTRTRTLSEREVATALGLEAVDRRTFLGLAVETGLVTLGHWIPRGEPAPVLLRFQALERALGKSLGEVLAEVGDLRTRRNHGEFQAVYERARWLFEHIYGDDHDPSAVANAPELAKVKLHVGFEYCESLAATQGWFHRTKRMVAALDRMEREVLLHVAGAHRQLTSEWAHLCNLRAPLYRMRSDAQRLRGAYEESIWELSWALNNLVSRLDEPTVHVELLRNRAHVYLLRGDVDLWRADLAQAQQVAHGMRGAEGETFQALVTYSWGEGYKHLASLPALPETTRKRYANDALADLGDGYTVFVRHRPWEGYALLAAIAQAQCLVWIDPEAALQRASQVQQLAQTLYPSLTEKTERVAHAARQQQEGQHTRRAHRTP